jgi:GWxTD domain-containing protein
MAPSLLCLLLGVLDAGSERPAIRPEFAAFQVNESLQRLELSYRIPFSAVVFTRDTSGYVARFTMRMSCADSRGGQLTADDWEHLVRLQEYDSTMRMQSVFSGRETLRVAMRPLVVDVAFDDRQSERAQSWRFKLDPPRLVSDLRLEPGGRAVLEARDTLRVRFETYDRGGELDSCRVRVVQGRRVYGLHWMPVSRDSWRQAYVWEFPLAALEDGQYEVQVEAASRRLKTPVLKRAGFQVGSSFFHTERAYQEKVNQLLYIATTAEQQALRKALPAERESLWAEFWKGKDRTPTTGRNETEEDYFRRIGYAIEHFGHGDRGYKSDRARVYVKLGPPDNTESVPFESHSNAYEVWHYYGRNLKLTFLDVNGFGEFKLVDPPGLFQDEEWKF